MGWLGRYRSSRPWADKEHPDGLHWSGRADGKPLLWLPLHLAGTAAIIGGLVAAFITLSHNKDDIYDWGFRVITDMQDDSSSAGRGFMHFVSFVGNAGLGIIIAIMLFGFSVKLGLRFAMMLFLSIFTNNFVRTLYTEPRPAWLYPVIFSSCNSIFGRPSGHSEASMAFFCLCALHVTHSRWMKHHTLALRIPLFVLNWVGALGLVAAVGVSRSYLGLHFPDQVFIGWLLGIFDLMLFLWIERAMIFLAPKLQRMTIFVYVLLAGVLTAIMVGLELMAYFVKSEDFVVPSRWLAGERHYCSDPFIDRHGSLNNALSAIAVFPWLFFLLEYWRRYVYYRPLDAPWWRRGEVYFPIWRRLLHAIVSVALAAAAFFGIGAIYGRNSKAVPRAVVDYYVKTLVALLLFNPVGFTISRLVRILPVWPEHVWTQDSLPQNIPIGADVSTKLVAEHPVGSEHLYNFKP